MKPILRIRDVSKCYRLGALRAQRSTLYDSLARWASAPFAWMRRSEAETFWALRDVSLDVRRGEVLGLIGRNGAGKSTLLKILSRITEPTSGEVELYGRVGSLLEVGTGFHHELTGRENIYLNGAILGMRRKEIERKFDEIVAFAEIGQFLDTPVKHYSSGMYMRLAFAVAAHLDPEILLVDEVLAVGDAAFQKKCLGKMENVARDGRTVLFVSHNMAAMRSLCQTCCVLDHGRIVRLGTAEECVSAYLAEARASRLSATVALPPTGESPRMLSATLLCNGTPSAVAQMGDHLTLEVEFAADPPVMYPRLGFVIASVDGTPLLNADNHYQQTADPCRPVRHGRIRCEMGLVPLMANRYHVSLRFGNQTLDTHVAENALTFDVVEHDAWGLGRVPEPNSSLLWWPTSFQIVGENAPD